MKNDVKKNTSCSGCCASEKETGGCRDIQSGALGGTLPPKETIMPIVCLVKKTENCLVCGETLVYSDKTLVVSCCYCGGKDTAHILCPTGHYICERCHNQDALQFIENIILTSTSTSPLDIAELAMSVPTLSMLGCQHAYIAGGSLLAAIKNSGKMPVTDEDIKEMFSRTRKQALGGYCGLTGVCGIVPALGACISILTGSRCGKDKEQRLTMEMVVLASRVIADLTGPSCCKAYVRSSVYAAVDFLREHLHINLSAGKKAECRFSDRHPHGCRKERCPYYHGGA